MPKSEFGCVGKKIEFVVLFLNESGPEINATGPSWQPETHYLANRKLIFQGVVLLLPLVLILLSFFYTLNLQYIHSVYTPLLPPPPPSEKPAFSFLYRIMCYTLCYGQFSVAIN